MHSMSSDIVKKVASSSSARLRSMNCPIWLPTVPRSSSSGSSGSSISRLKNSITPSTRSPSRMGNPSAACSPSSSAMEARGKFVSFVTSGIQAGARLVPNNEVRIGGTRVGVVESIDAVRLPENENAGDDGSDVTATAPTGPDGNTDGVVARLNLKLDKSASPIPENSIFRIRYKSAFGLKYLEITRGDGPAAPEGFVFNGTNDNDDPADTDNQILSIDEVAKNRGADDGTFIAQTEFDEIGNTFDQPTRNAIRENLDGYGDGFAGRGASLNQAVEALNPLLTNLKPVA